MTDAHYALIFMGGPALLLIAGLIISAAYGAWRLK